MIPKLAKAAFFALLVSTSLTAHGAALITNGGFEAGSLDGWAGAGQQGGFAQAVTEDYCFSAFDTTGITFAGNYAAMLRAGPKAPAGSFASLTSAPFTAGIGIGFNALTQTLSKKGIDKMPVTFVVRILSQEGTPLVSVGLNTHVRAQFWLSGIASRCGFLQSLY